MHTSVKEITKLENISLSDFTLCEAELLHAKERKISVLCILESYAVKGDMEVLNGAGKI